MEGRLLLNVVVRQSPPVFKLLSRKNQALLIGRNANGGMRKELINDNAHLPFLVLDFGLHIVNSV